MLRAVQDDTEQRSATMPSKMMRTSYRSRRSHYAFFRMPNHNVLQRRASIVATLASVFASTATILGYCLCIPDPDISRELAQHRADVARGSVRVLGRSRVCRAMAGDQPFNRALVWSRTGRVIDSTNATPATAGGNWRHDDADIANLISFIRSNWHDGMPPLAEAAKVSKALYLGQSSLSDDRKPPCLECMNLTSSKLQDETGRLDGRTRCQ
jgi:hypothetical protein